MIYFITQHWIALTSGTLFISGLVYFAIRGGLFIQVIEFLGDILETISEIDFSGIDFPDIDL